jgi:adenylate cyclase
VAPPRRRADAKTGTFPGADEADMPGFAAESGDSASLVIERSLLAWPDPIRGRFHERRGRVFNTAGDAIPAEFGSAVEAVRCATEIQPSLRTRNDQLPSERQVNFRIGVNLGDVMVQGADAAKQPGTP